jgi:hypothetical protein
LPQSKIENQKSKIRQRSQLLRNSQDPCYVPAKQMNEVSEAIVRWLEQKRRTERKLAAVLSILALGSGTAVFLLGTVVIYTILFIFCGPFNYSSPWLGLGALGLTAGVFVLSMRGKQDRLDFDPMGFWIIKDVCSFGPRLILEGLQQIRRFGELGELNVAACARALAYLARQNAAIGWDELTQHCPQLSPEHFKQQLSLLDGVLFLGKDASRVTLMEPFRLLLRSMLKQEMRAGGWQEAAPPRHEPPPQAMPVDEPEKLSPYEILGLSPPVSVAEIRTAYRQRVKACHPDLFAGMDPQARALAERWTKALNAAYATLNPRRGRKS